MSVSRSVSHTTVSVDSQIIAAEPPSYKWPLLGSFDGRESSNERRDCDPYQTSMITTNKNENCCLFLACLNVLDNLEQKLAFTSNDLEHPTHAFKSMFPERDGGGYNGADILQHLKHLQDQGYIRDFEWKVITSFEWPYCILTKPHEVGTKYIVVGVSPCSDLADEIQDKVKKDKFTQFENGPDQSRVITKKRSESGNRTYKVVSGKRRHPMSKQAVCKSAKSMNSSARKDKFHTKNYLKHSHAIGIRYEPWLYDNCYKSLDCHKEGFGVPVLFDNKFESSHAATPDYLGRSVYSVLKLYSFKLYL